METLSPEGWLARVQDWSAFLWAGSLVVTQIFLKLIMDSKLKMPYPSHVMIVPRLMAYMYRKQLGKEADLLITLPVGLYFWKMENHESLILDFLLPVVKSGTLSVPLVNWRNQYG